LQNLDDKDLAIGALTLIAIMVIIIVGEKGLDVITNIVCALGGFVTGKMIKEEEKN